MLVLIIIINSNDIDIPYNKKKFELVLYNEICFFNNKVYDAEAYFIYGNLLKIEDLPPDVPDFNFNNFHLEMNRNKNKTVKSQEDNKNKNTTNRNNKENITNHNLNTNTGDFNSIHINLKKEDNRVPRGVAAGGKSSQKDSKKRNINTLKQDSITQIKSEDTNRNSLSSHRSEGDLFSLLNTDLLNNPKNSSIKGVKDINTLPQFGSNSANTTFSYVSDILPNSYTKIIKSNSSTNIIKIDQQSNKSRLSNTFLKNTYLEPSNSDIPIHTKSKDSIKSSFWKKDSVNEQDGIRIKSKDKNNFKKSSMFINNQIGFNKLTKTTNNLPIRKKSKIAQRQGFDDKSSIFNDSSIADDSNVDQSGIRDTQFNNMVLNSEKNIDIVEDYERDSLATHESQQQKAYFDDLDILCKSSKRFNKHFERTIKMQDQIVKKNESNNDDQLGPLDGIENMQDNIIQFMNDGDSIKVRSSSTDKAITRKHNPFFNQSYDSNNLVSNRTINSSENDHDSKANLNLSNKNQITIYSKYKISKILNDDLNNAQSNPEKKNYLAQIAVENPHDKGFEFNYYNNIAKENALNNKNKTIIDNEKRNKNATIADFEEIKIADRNKYDFRSFGIYLKDLILDKNICLCIFFKKSLLYLEVI